MQRILMTIPLVAAALAVGCNEPPSGAAPSPPSSASAPRAPASAAPATAAAAKGDKPRMSEHKETPGDRLGVLPQDLGIPAGQKAPDAVVRDTEGREVHLDELFKKGHVLLVFYRGGWCPYCNFQIHALTQANADFQRRGVTPVAISVDKQDEAAKSTATHAVPFPVLSDPELIAHKAFKVIHHADDEEVARLKGFGVDLEKRSGMPHHSFAVPAIFLIEKGGTVKWAHADIDYKVRPRTAQLLAAVDAAGLK